MTLLPSTEYIGGMTLAEWMDRKGLKAVDVCRGAGISPPALSRFLNSGSALSAKNMSRIVRFTKGRVGYADLVPCESEATT